MKIAQITDLHLRGHIPGTSSVALRRSRVMPSLLREALSELRAEGVDAVALTGDLLDVPHWLMHPTPGFETDDPPPWRDAVRADYQHIKTMLDNCGLPYLVLPGNHDWPEVMWEVFDPMQRSLEIKGCRIVRFCDYEHSANVPRRFYPERDFWEDELRRSAELPQVHLQHYVIYPTLDEGYPYNYAEAEFLSTKLSESTTTTLCLSGHFHRGIDLVQLGRTTFAGSPAFCDAPHRYRIFSLVDDTITTKELCAEPRDAQQCPAVFLDRDGVINDLSSYRYGPERMRLLPGAAEAVRRFKDAGYRVVVVTNQSCVGMGYVPAEVMYSVNDRMCRLIRDASDAEIDAIYFSLGAGSSAVLPEYRDTTTSKPEPALLLKAGRELNLLMSDSWFIGDHLTDIQAGAAAGVRPVLVRSGAGATQESACAISFPAAPVLDDLGAAAKWVLSQSQALPTQL